MNYEQRTMNYELRLSAVALAKAETMNYEQRTMNYEQRLSAVALAKAETTNYFLQNKPNFPDAKFFNKSDKPLLLMSRNISVLFVDE